MKQLRKALALAIASVFVLSLSAQDKKGESIDFG